MTDPVRPLSPGVTQTNMALERTWLAYDRTILSWIRGAISLIAFGFGLEQVFRALKPDSSEAIAHAHVIGVAMVVIGLLSLLFASLQYRADLRRLQHSYPPSQGYPVVPLPRAGIFAALVAFLGLLALFDMLLR